jgi:hypothetical protein
MLAISPVFSPNIKRQIKRARSQMVTFGMASSGAVFFKRCQEKILMRFPPINYLPRGLHRRTGLSGREGKKEPILTMAILYTFRACWQEAKEFFLPPLTNYYIRL